MYSVCTGWTILWTVDILIGEEPPGTVPYLNSMQWQACALLGGAEVVLYWADLYLCSSLLGCTVCV
jgi:hypothetical protein